MLTFRHITLGLVAAMISTQALAGWVPLGDAALPTARMLFTSGQKRSIADFKGKVVVLNLWASWCGPCLKELPTLDALEQELASKGLVVIPLSVDTTVPPAELRALIDEGKLSLPHTALDNTRMFNRQLVAGSGIPLTYLIDRKGVLRYKYIGSTDWMDSRRRDKVEELLAESQ